MTCHTYVSADDPTAPECQRAGGVAMPGGCVDGDLPPNLDECDGLLDVWLSRHGRP